MAESMAGQAPDTAGKPERGAVSGRVIVVVLFTGALLLWGIVFLVGLRQRASDRREAEARYGVDSAASPEQVRAWMKALPEKWVKVSPIEGQGYVLYVPCYSSNSSLTLRTFPDSLPGLTCEYCDSLSDFSVRGITRTRMDSAWEFRLNPPAGRLRVLPVSDSLLKAFPEAPFRGRLLLWTRSLAEGRTDTMIFVPKSQESEFEALRAEDENPEGCGGTEPD